MLAATNEQSRTAKMRKATKQQELTKATILEYESWNMTQQQKTTEHRETLTHGFAANYPMVARLEWLRAKREKTVHLCLSKAPNIVSERQASIPTIATKQVNPRLAITRRLSASLTLNSIRA